MYGSKKGQVKKKEEKINKWDPDADRERERERFETEKPRNRKQKTEKNRQEEAREESHKRPEETTNESTTNETTNDRQVDKPNNRQQQQRPNGPNGPNLPLSLLPLSTSSFFLWYQDPPPQSKSIWSTQEKFAPREHVSQISAPVSCVRVIFQKFRTGQWSDGICS